MTTVLHVKTSTGQQHNTKMTTTIKWQGSKKRCHTTYKGKTLNANNTTNNEYATIINYDTKTQNAELQENIKTRKTGAMQ